MSPAGYQKKNSCAGIDWFRILAAVMVIAIHIGPLSNISSDMDYLVTYCAGRVAVPFFLMTTGYFVIAPWKMSRGAETGRVLRFLKKTLLLYGVSIALYLPVNLYAGELPDSVGGLFRMLLFDGTFYHLWYFPAVILGCLLTMAMLRKLSVRTVFILAFVLYLVGVGGDSWFGLVTRIPGAGSLYDMVFTVSSYTRNGVFFAPMFLMLGTLVRENERHAGQKDSICGRTGVLVAELMFGMVLMLGEGYLSCLLNVQRHNSMYLFLIPVMYVLFRLLLKVPGHAPAWTRDVSMLVYVIHPAVLIVLRGIAGAAGLTDLLVENTLIQFVSVTALSFAAAAVIHFLLLRMKHFRRRREAR